ncbi:MAG: hypothetical protein JW850_13390 [Thermoflexales bacterium]|nr:hypothetical protein [Thermoflexales bacterium]
MISAYAWWSVMHNYSLAIVPAQILFYLLAVATLVVFFRQPGESANRVIKGFFVLAFGWIGVVLFLLLGQELPAHNVQAVLFLSLAALFTLDLLTNTSQFSMPQAGWRRSATIIGFGLVMAAYPLVGIVQGRPASKWLIPGTFPCPTTALALIFMTTAWPSKHRWLYFVSLGLLLIWAIPFPLMIQIPKFGVYEDGIMVMTGLYSIVMLAINWPRPGGVEIAPHSRAPNSSRP